MKRPGSQLPGNQLSGNQLRRRVIVSATCFADADAVIEMAASLARTIEGEILGLLIEEDAILRYANLPSAKVLTFQRGSVQHVTPGAMDSAFQRDAKFFERRLADAARQATIHWSFEHKRGQMMPLLQSVASTGDFIFLGYQQTRVSRGEIVFIDCTGGRESHLLSLSKQFAREMNLSLQTINLSTSGEPGKNAKPQMEALIKARAKAGTRPFFSAINANEDEMLEYLRKSSPTAVVVAQDAEHTLDLHEMLKAARCSVILSVEK